MKRITLLALIGLLFFAWGCGENHHHNFFKPEMSGAFYAAPQRGDGPTADDARAILDPKAIRCDGADPMCIDIGEAGLYEGWQFVDDGAYYAAPRIDRLSQ